MEKIFAGHSKLLQFDAGIDLSAMATKTIKYRKPDGTTGEWAATLSGTSVLEKQITDEFNQLGVWHLQGFASAGSTSWIGDEVKVHIVKRPTI